MLVTAIFGVKCRSENPRTVGFYIIFYSSVVFVCQQSYEFEYYLSFRTIFFPNNAETNSVGHLGPHEGFLNVRK